MSYPEYPAYKKSDIVWLEAIPCHWSVNSLKHIARIIPSNVDKHSDPDEIPVCLCNYTDVYYRDKITTDLDFMRATASADELKRFYLFANDVVITKDSETADDIAVPAFVPETLDSVICGYHLSIIRPDRDIVGRFIHYWFLSAQSRAYFEVSAKGLTRVGLSQGALGAAPIAVPPPDEQARIAQFLDHEIARIDALIGGQQRLIDLLREKRQAVTSHAVTKGLDPDVPMEDSGVEWIGSTPVHWQVGKIGWWFDVQLGKMLDEARITGEHLAPYLRNTDVQWDQINITDLPEMDFPAGERERYKLKRGDLLVCEGGEIGRAAIWPYEDFECYYQKALHRVRSMGSGRASFLLWVLRSVSERGILDGSATSSTINHLTRDQLRRMVIPFPPIDEQEKIAEHITSLHDAFRTLEAEADKTITLLEEHRSALISAAVTGKIDVRSWKSEKGSDHHDLPQAAETEAPYG